MKKFILVLAFLSLAAPWHPRPASCQYVEVPKEKRIFNRSGVQCFWCAAETACRTLRIEEGYGLTETYKDPPDGWEEGLQILRSHGIKCQLRDSGSLLSWRKALSSLESNYPVVFGTPGHALLLVGYDKDDTKGVWVIDNSGADACKVQSWSQHQFWERWDGHMIYLWKDR